MRPVINLKRLNEFIALHHFKMEGIHIQGAEGLREPSMESHGTTPIEGGGAGTLFIALCKKRCPVLTVHHIWIINFTTT